MGGRHARKPSAERQPRTRSRETRDEKRARIRASLIESAAELFAERGYWGVSIDEIAERAGLTKGAVYSNFESKEDLLLEVAIRQSVEGDTSFLQDSSLSLQELAQRIGDDVARLATSDEVRALAPRELELATLSLTSEKVRSALIFVSRLQHAAIAALVTERARRDGLELVLPTEEIAVIFRALARGLTQVRALDPESIPESYFADALALIVSGATRPSRPRKSRQRQPRAAT